MLISHRGIKLGSRTEFPLHLNMKSEWFYPHEQDASLMTKGKSKLHWESTFCVSDWKSWRHSIVLRRLLNVALLSFEVYINKVSEISILKGTEAQTLGATISSPRNESCHLLGHIELTAVALPEVCMLPECPWAELTRKLEFVLHLTTEERRCVLSQSGTHPRQTVKGEALSPEQSPQSTVICVTAGR